VKIAIIGTGRMGSGLAKAWAKAGHEIFLGSRDASKAKAVADEIKKSLPQAKVSSGGHDEAAKDSEVVLIATPYRSVADTVKKLRNLLSGKVIIDITNPFDAVPSGPTSGIEEVQKSVGSWYNPMAAFKTNFAKTLDNPTDKSGVKRDVLICGDDQKAKSTVIKLAEEIGFRAVDCGGLKAARTLDLMVPLMIEMDKARRGDASASWKFLG
jgi:NADPH-dependent F420 reductase